MVRELKHCHNCDHCGDWFESSRYDARFCSAKCRKRESRESKQAALAVARITELVEDYRSKQIVNAPVGIALSNANKLRELARTLKALVENYG
jgi:hypothetical protein